MDQVPDHGSPTSSGYAMGITSSAAVERTASPVFMDQVPVHLSPTPVLRDRHHELRRRRAHRPCCRPGRLLQHR
jgi:hypothetical protein